MLSNDSSASEINKARDTIISEVEWLDELIERTLSFVRFDHGRVVDLLSPDDIVRTVCERFQPLLQNTGHELHLTLSFNRRGRIDRWALEAATASHIYK